MPRYSGDIISSFADAGIKKDSFVVEIGANDGEFLRMLSLGGYVNTLAVEPSKGCAGILRHKGIRVLEAHFDSGTAREIRETNGPAGLIICRHVIEHVPDPLGFLLAMRELIDKDGVLYVETPDSRYIIRDMTGHDLWDEHVLYFTPDNLCGILGRAGFRKIKEGLFPFRDTMNIGLWCVPATDVSFDAPKAVEIAGGYRLFAERWKRIGEEMRERVSRAPKPVAAMGASHHQSGYLIFTGVGEYVSMLIDEDLLKAGRYVPVPRPVRVYTSGEAVSLTAVRPATLLRTAFGYDEWMDRVCREFGRDGVSIIEPYPL